jgi:hypothetical protein
LGEVLPLCLVNADCCGALVCCWHISDLPHWSLHVRYGGEAEVGQNAPEKPFSVPRRAGFHDIPQIRTTSGAPPDNGIWLMRGDMVDHHPNSSECSAAINPENSIIPKDF